nr:MAG TPA: hypothetical protein [Caudoviricetes sp.]
MSKQTNTQTGIGFWGLLQIVLITLKILGYIKAAWWLVLLPSIISVALTIIVLIFFLFFYFLCK